MAATAPPLPTQSGTRRTKINSLALSLLLAVVTTGCASQPPRAQLSAAEIEALNGWYHGSSQLQQIGHVDSFRDLKWRCPKGSFDISVRVSGGIATTHLYTTKNRFKTQGELNPQGELTARFELLATAKDGTTTPVYFDLYSHLPSGDTEVTFGSSELQGSCPAADLQLKKA